MDQIAEQLKAEIVSLEEYIRTTEERLRVAGWVSELLGPFDRVEHDLDEDELKSVVTALHQARFQFSINGRLSGRIDEILERYESLVADLRLSGRAVSSLPARDPDEPEPEFQESDTAASLFTVGTEDEEAESLEFFTGEVDEGLALDQDDSAGALFDAVPPYPEEPASAPESLLLTDAALPPQGRSRPSKSGRSIPPSPRPTRQPPPGAAGEPFAAPESQVVEEDALPAAGSAEELFTEQNDPEDSPRRGTAEAASPRRRRMPEPVADPESAPGHQAPRQPVQPVPPARRRAQTDQAPEPRPVERYQPSDTELAGPVDIFSAKVGLDDLLTRMGIGIPANDRVELDHLLHNRLMDRTFAALRTAEAFEKQYVLIPRLSRLIHDGKVCPCTLKTLAKVFTGMFGNIQDLIQFRSFPFLTREAPEPGWALVTPEAPKETLGKTYMEQNQYLRYLAATVGVPSHLVRRRTLVEAVYDLIVSRMVLGDPWQRRTSDWTATGTSKTDFVCVFFSDQGIRLRDLPRTTKNRALGLSPNW